MDIHDIAKENKDIFEKTLSGSYTLIDEMMEDFPDWGVSDISLYVVAANKHTNTMETTGNIDKDTLSIVIEQNDDNAFTLSLGNKINNTYYEINCTTQDNPRYEYRYCRFYLKCSHNKHSVHYTIRQMPAVDTDNHYLIIQITNTTVLTNVLYNTDYSYVLYSFKFINNKTNTSEYMNILFEQYSTYNKYFAYIVTLDEIPENKTINYIKSFAEPTITTSTRYTGQKGRPCANNLLNESIITEAFSPVECAHHIWNNYPQTYEYGTNIGYSLLTYPLDSDSYNNFKVISSKKVCI